MTTPRIPDYQRAVQLVASNELRLNERKPVPRPGPHQILGEVEAVGLCFSDLKLLKQFAQHPRKSEVTSGISAEALMEMPNYVPGDKPVVPGHEAVVRVVDVGPGVTGHRIGERYLVQTDYRWLPTAKSNAAFGYNFEGALQEFVLMDTRVITSPDGESLLIPVPEDFSASAIALVEPWACVENAYAEPQRRGLKPGGRCIVIADTIRELETARLEMPGCPAVIFAAADHVGELEAVFDDVIYFGSDAEVVEKLFAKLLPGGLLGVLQCGKRFGRDVRLPVGRVHYGGVRIVGTKGDSYRTLMAGIPANSELRANDKLNIIGAAGPMGTMHVIRALCRGLEGITVYAGDLSDERLSGLARVAEPLAKANRCAVETYNPSQSSPPGPFDYIVIMAPVPALVRSAVATAAPNAIINVFAGLPADVDVEFDLNRYIENRLYFVGTSGSELKDMKQVLTQLVSRKLDTNLSVAAVSGLEGAIDGIRAVEKNAMPGKIVVYPACRGLPLTALSAPPQGTGVTGGHWTKETEAALLKHWAAS